MEESPTIPFDHGESKLGRFEVASFQRRNHTSRCNISCFRYPANNSCEDEEGAFDVKSPIELKPGSLVCSRSHRDPHWPAIVEFSLDTCADYCLKDRLGVPVSFALRSRTPNFLIAIHSTRSAFPLFDPQHAYYITFIGADFGGWFEAGKLRSFRGDEAFEGRSNPEMSILISSCVPYLQPPSCDLRKRLLDLSHCANKVKTRRFLIPP